MTFELFDFQKEAADIMASRERFGCHDEMGVGKTATTIGAVNRIMGRRGLIICPAMLRENWLREFKKFSTYDLRVCKGRNVHDYVAWKRDRFDVLVTSYEQAVKFAPDFVDECETIDFMATDEAHYLKNPESKRTRAVYGFEASGDGGIVQWANQAWDVSGTRMPNDPMDIYTFLRFAKAIDMDPSEFAKYFFTKRTSTYGARYTAKEETLSVLRQLIGNNSIARTHAEVGMELPPIWLTETLIEGDTIAIEEAMAGYPHLEELIIYALETGDIGALDATHIATVRRLVGKAKAVPYAQLLKMELDGGAGKRVVFCVHTEPLLYVRNYLIKHGYRPVVAYGDTPEHERQNAVQSFMEDPSVDVFIGNMKVAGVGLTLTQSSEIDVLESSWSPADNAQAIKRVHRYGQTQDVRARFITLANSIDVAVNRVVSGKTAAIAEIDGHAMTAAPLLTA